jgi:ribosomal protein S27AE
MTPGWISWRCDRCGFEERRRFLDLAKALKYDGRATELLGRTPHVCPDGACGALVFIAARTASEGES